MPTDADHVATIGENRKLLIFKLAELPEMARGKGVRLQKFKDGGLSDATTLNLKAGLNWIDSQGREWTVTDLGRMDWRTRASWKIATQRVSRRTITSDKSVHAPLNALLIIL